MFDGFYSLAAAAIRSTGFWSGIVRAGNFEGWRRVGTPYWFCTSASRCPVEVRWRETAGTLEQLGD